MRANTPGSRFSVQSEIDRYWTAIDEDLQTVVGGSIPWYRYDSSATQVDSIYDVGAANGVGRQFKPPVMLKYVGIHLIQGQTLQSTEGAYNFDMLKLTVNMPDILRFYPDAQTDEDAFFSDSLQDDLLSDRFIFNGKVFRPIQAQLLGRVADRYALLSLSMMEVHDEEMVNDPQFSDYSE